MLLPAVSLVDRFCMSRMVGEGEVGRFTHKVNIAWLGLGSAVNTLKPEPFLLF